MPQNDFFEDGFYFLRPKNHLEQEPIIESIHFINESLLLVVTQNRESRVLYTHNFTYGKFQSPVNTAFDNLDTKQTVKLEDVLSDEEDEIREKKLLNE